MDVVKTNIEKIGGTVDVQSKPGTGTTVRMKIPLTLAIIPALIVTSGGDRYAIPQISLLELVRLDGEDAQKGIELIQGVPVHRLRGRLLPLVYLNRELKVEDEAPDLSKLPAVNIVVLQADERQFGLVVDEINDTEEIVVKPLGKQLKRNQNFRMQLHHHGRRPGGADSGRAWRRANFQRRQRKPRGARSVRQGSARHASTNGERQTMLLFQCGPDGRMAMDLSLVARLEEFKPEMVECAGDAQVVQYRGQIMPLLRVSDVLPGDHGDGSLRRQRGKRDRRPKTLQVVVYSEQGRSVGLVVDRILDIVEETIVPQQPSKRDGLLGSAVIQQRVTDLLDVRGFVRTANPDFFETPVAAEER